MMMISKGIAEIVRNFDLEFEVSQNEWTVDSAWFVWPTYSCRVRAREKWFCARTDVTNVTEGKAAQP